MNLTTTLTYDAQTTDLVDSMTTPYGTWNFTTQLVNPSDSNDVQTLDITDPVGQHQRAQYGHNLYSPPTQPSPTGMLTEWQWWEYRNTYYWDANTMAQTGAVYSKAKIYHWQHTPDNEESNVLEAVQAPLEARVFFDYPGQIGAPFENGVTLFRPQHVGRVLDDGTTQRDSYQYNAFGKITQHVDPAGKVFNYSYASNLLDLLSISDGNGEVLSSYQYNGPAHLPTTVLDAGGEPTQLGYNSGPVDQCPVAHRRDHPIELFE